MSFESLSALPAGILFALVTSITPGPNNTMLLASGVNFGFRRTLPHVFGISLGVVVLMLAVGFGLGEAFQRFPVLYTVLEIASVAYLLYLAWKIGTSGEVKLRSGERRPMKLIEAAAFQWVNPKAWMMVLTAATTIQRPVDGAAVLRGRPSVHRAVGRFRYGHAASARGSEAAAHLQRRDGAAAGHDAVSDCGSFAELNMQAAGAGTGRPIRYPPARRTATTHLPSNTAR
jgi:hypothetical protein